MKKNWFVYKLIYEIPNLELVINHSFRIRTFFVLKRIKD